MKKEYNLTINDIMTKLANDELALGDSFESDYGSIFYVGKQDNSVSSSNKVLRWASSDNEVGITSITATAKYRISTKYERITYKKLFSEIRKGSDSIYYSHETKDIKHLNLDNLGMLFDMKDIKGLKFYTKNF